MSGPIDSQAAIDAVLGVIPYDDYWKEQVEKAINNLPSADVQPVVRCKDCIWWDNSPVSTMTPMHRACKRVGRMGTQAEDFCSFGERRDNGHD